MSQRGHTKDEKFIIALYDEAMKLGDPYSLVDCYFIGKKLGLHAHATEIICRELAHANFIKKEDKNTIYLTPNGERLVQRLTV